MKLSTFAQVTFVAAALIGSASIIGGLLVPDIAALDAATASQCANQDWPSDKHQAHVDFCTTYGYQVGS